jgi:hypothetical protein
VLSEILSTFTSEVFHVTSLPVLLHSTVYAHRKQNKFTDVTVLMPKVLACVQTRASNYVEKLPRLAFTQRTPVSSSPAVRLDYFLYLNILIASGCQELVQIYVPGDSDLI